MKTHGGKAGGLTILGVALALAGCSCWSFQPPMRGNADFAPYNVAKLRAAVPASPADFNQGLISDYGGLAGSLHDELNDYADADYFARKGLATARGQVVPPENNANWLVPLEVPEQYRTQLAQYRTRLVAALDKGGREQQPLVAARAQVSYDCWVERMEDDWRSAINGACRQQFLDALARLEGAAPPAAPAAAAPGGREYRVYFEFDKADLLPEAQQILTQVAGRVKQDEKLRIELVGKADRAGGDKYNMTLSHRRAEAVRDALIGDGVAAGRITTRWVGEREPPVPTSPGVREPRNRLVEIVLH